MKRMMAAILFGGLISIGAVGCSEKTTASTKQESKVTTPGGTTTTTTTVEKEVKKTGDHPPATTP